MARLSFECQVCLDRKQERDPRIIDKSPVCRDCVTDQVLPLFHAALDHEHQFPPRWGGLTLNIVQFATQLGKDFVDRYRRREIEYRSTERIYCKHKILAKLAPATGARAPWGRKLALTPAGMNSATADGERLVECGGLVSGRAQRSDQTLSCYRCNGQVCCACETPLAMVREEHECKRIERTSLVKRPYEGQESENDPLRGQKQGRDFQRCPSCANVVALKDGCNSMRCNQCSTDFCYICGKRAHHDSSHWAIGKPCPRWNQPGGSNARHDGPADLEGYEMVERLLGELLR